MKEEGYAYEDQGALVVDVKEDSDTKEVPPCILLKSDGASLYTTTDLATIVERMKLFHPQEICILWTSARRCILPRCSAAQKDGTGSGGHRPSFFWASAP